MSIYKEKTPKKGYQQNHEQSKQEFKILTFMKLYKSQKLIKIKPTKMIASNHQKNIWYYKQYPCYSVTTHLSEHRELQFANIVSVEFSKKTLNYKYLPKYCIDKYQKPHRMYWLEWRMEEVLQQVIQEGRKQRSDPQSKTINPPSNPLFQSSKFSNKILRRCLYVAQLGKMAHIKLVFNYDPQIVAICQDYLYAVGGGQLIVTELWPQSMPSTKIMDPGQQIPPKQSQIVHKLDPNSKILSLDFIYSQSEEAVCSIVYFHSKKGYLSQAYSKTQSLQVSIINRLIEMSLKFRKSEQEPLFYSTLVPNILGMIVHTQKQFSLLNLTDMKIIPNTRKSLQGWQLDRDQPVLVRCHQNKVNEGFNDCLTISIGQGSNIEIFLYHLRFSTTATIISPVDNSRNPASTFEHPISFFTSAQFIQFQTSQLRHFTIVNLKQLSCLQDYVLTKSGIIYLGYKNSKSGSNEFQQLPVAGYVQYDKPYITHQILMQENKIWSQYKFDMLSTKNSKGEVSRQSPESLSRVLSAGRYDKSFILKTLQLQKVSQLDDKLRENSDSFNQINQKLAFEWRNKYKFVQFVIFKQEVLIIRRNSIGALVCITQQQFVMQRDSLSQPQVSYDQLLSRGFSVRYDLEGDQYVDEDSNPSHHRNEINAIQGDGLHRNCKTYQQKIRSINTRVQNFMQQRQFENGLQQQKKLGEAGYYDQQQMRKHSNLYGKAINKIFQLSLLQQLKQLPETSLQDITVESTQFLLLQKEQGSLSLEQTQLLLHIEILSLRLKDQLTYYVNTLKSNYHYYFEHLVNQANEQNRNNQKLRNTRQQITRITRQKLHKIHLRHIYVVFVLEWIVNLGSKSHLREQYQLFGHDLIEVFVQDYIYSYYKKVNNLRVSDQRKHTHGNFFKTDLPVHVDNILSLMFKGLICEFNPLSSSNLNISQIIQPQKISHQRVVLQQVNYLDRKSNRFILMMLKRHQQVVRNTWQDAYQRDNQNICSSSQTFITDSQLLSLIQPLVLQPLNPNIRAFLPVNKTFVYALLNLPIMKVEKTRILSSHLTSKEFLALLLLIQIQNNCYLSIEQDGESLQLPSTVEQFQENSHKLSKENCCIIEELILLNYKLFAFPQQIQNSSIISQPLYSKISRQQSIDQAQLIQRRHPYFIKNLFSNIDFMYLTSVLINGRNSSQGEQRRNNMMVAQEKSTFQNKSIVQIYKQFIQQVQEINERCGRGRGSKIERAFKKFYHKIYRPISQIVSKGKIRNQYSSGNGTSSIYPQMTGLGYNLNMWQLQKIDRLYRRHLKVLKAQKKHSFESTSLVQQRMNLQYSMLKIHLYRLKIALKQISSLVYSQKEQYAQIMRRCVLTLKQSINSMKHFISKLGNQSNEQVSDQQVLQMLKETYQMQNSKVWDEQSEHFCDKGTKMISQQTALQEEDQKWCILGVPITSQWLQLLQLTFQESPSSQGRSSQCSIFTNYHSMDSIIMKILKTIKEQSLSKEQLQQLNHIFGSNRIQSIIKGNQELHIYYNLSGEKGKYRNINNNPSLGLLSNVRMEQLSGYAKQYF